MKLLLYVFLGWNLIAFFVMGLDKYKSMHRRRRISEAGLLWLAFMMGAAGCIAGSLVFHHKTKKIKFEILFPVALVCNCGLFMLFHYYSAR